MITCIIIHYWLQLIGIYLLYWSLTLHKLGIINHSEFCRALKLIFSIKVFKSIICSLKGGDKLTFRVRWQIDYIISIDITVIDYLHNYTNNLFLDTKVILFRIKVLSMFLVHITFLKHFWWFTVRISEVP